MIRVTHSIKTPDSADEISNTPSGTISSTNVQDALNELDGDLTALDASLGTAAVEDVGTSGHTLPFLDGANTWSDNQTFSTGIFLGSTLLNDYEEGTFTPSFSASGATFNHQTQSGRYTKIGNTVFYTIDMFLGTSGNTLTANALSITGLPFTSLLSSIDHPVVHWASSSTSYVYVSARVLGNSSAVSLVGITAASATILTVATADGLLHPTNGSRVRVSGFYRVS